MINLCFVTDDGYAMPTGVTIYSIYKNRNLKNKYAVYILGKDISDENKNQLKKLDCENFKIHLIDCVGEDYSNLYLPGIPATPTSIYKFFIPNILSDIDRVLYLDGDIIVKNDLEELYKLNLGDNYIGAVKDSIGLSNKKYLDGNYSYINSGVMLMDLDKMRRNDIPNKLLEYRKTGYNKFMDQDAFNYVLKGKILQLPFKYNTQLNVISTAIGLNRDYTVENIVKYWKITEDVASFSDIFNHSLILHYTRAKPWKYYDGYGNDLWLFYYYNSQYGDTSILRESYHIKKIVSTKTYKLSSFLSSIKKNILKVLKSLKKSKQNEFLEQFYSKK